ncbi:MAG: penicillin-binding protein 2 [Campylobacteraceae bacterium 4484_166]|nr:MAG: penicillin-binding protein 2 [Campylobacteraceae bacterium 4484_166]
MRFKFVIIFIELIVLLLMYKIYYISIYSNKKYKDLSELNHIKIVNIPPVRGIITDRNDIPIAINKLGFSILVAPHMLYNKKDKEELDKLLDLICLHFPDINKADLMATYKKEDSKYNHSFIELVNYIPYKIFFSKYPIFNSTKGLKIKSVNKRYYPYGEVGSHIIGYTGRVTKKDRQRDEKYKFVDIIGKTGLENFYNEDLQGKPGKEKLIVNALNQPVKQIYKKRPTSKNIKTTIDIKLQKYINSLFKIADENSTEPKTSGAVVVMDIKNGEILSAGSYPEYDPNLFTNGISHEDWNNLMYSPDKPFTNKLVHGLYPPGSVIKMAMAVGFLEHKATKYHSVFCRGETKVGNRNFRCWKHYGHNSVDFRKAIRESCDVFFYEGSLVVGIDYLSVNLSRFGFGQKTGIDLSREFVGINPNKRWKIEKYDQPWYAGETANSAIGQGYTLVTPMQIARYTSALTNGLLPTPHLKFDDKLNQTKDLNISQKILNVVQKGMIDVVQHDKGTARWGIRSSVKIAGKTGTAQVASIPKNIKKRINEKDLEYYKRSHAWLTTYAPYDKPQYVVTVLLEHGGHGGGACGPYVSKIYNKLKELGYIKSATKERKN